VSLRDIVSRITRALEALRDGDREMAIQTLDDLGADLLAAAIGAEEKVA